MKRIYIAAFSFVLFVLSESPLHATTITATSCSQTNVQNAINSAAPGDTVVVPAGNCTWTTPAANTPSVSITKAITLQGAGIDQTIITDQTTALSGENALTANANGFRITGFTFTYNIASQKSVGLDGTNWRVDHNKFVNNTGGNAYALEADGQSGVIDSNIFMNLASIAVFGDGNASWSAPSSIGGSNAIFIEGNTFNFTEVGDGVFDGYDGARIVFRFNTVNNTQFGVHGLDSGPYRSTFSWEIYNNYMNNQNAAIWTAMNFRGGSGVIFNNTVTGAGGSYNSLVELQNYRSDSSYSSQWGPCDGSNPLDGNTAGGQGYPCKDQIGRSTNQSASPVYSWNNSYKGSAGLLSADGVARLLQFHVLANRDFYNNTQKPGYTPYACPNPITGISGGCNSSIAGIGGYGSGGSGDTTNPTITLTAPANGATITGTSVTVSATASDNVAVVGVQFKLDGVNLGAEDTTSPYSITWNSTTGTNGTHALTAVARDAAGNTATATSVSVTVNNGAPLDTQAPTVPTGLTATSVGPTQINLQWNASTDNVGVTGYRVYSGGLLLTTVAGTTFQSSGLSALTFYSYTVSAYDAAGNISGQSTNAGATTLSTTSTNTHYVDNSGSPACSNNASGGTESNPWCTVQYGISQIAGGDTLYVKNGTYNEAFTITGPSGSAAKHTVISAYPGHTPILRGAGFSGGRMKISHGCSYIDFVGFELTNYNQGLYVDDDAGTDVTCTNILVDRVHVHDVGQEGIAIRAGSLSGPVNVIVRNSEVDHTGRLGSTSNGEAIYVGNSGGVDNTNGVTILNNKFHDAQDECVELKGDSHDVIVDGNDIYNCLSPGSSYSNGGGAIEIDEPRNSTTDPHHIIRNNKIHDITFSSGITKHGIRAGTGASIYNNVLYNINSGYSCIVSDTSTYTRLIYHNTIDCTTGNAVVNNGTMDSRNNIGPATANNTATSSSYFVNQAAANYHLVAGSVPVNAGVNLTSTVPVDIEGVSRSANSPPDLGAYEFVGGATIDNIAPIVSITIAGP